MAKDKSSPPKSPALSSDMVDGVELKRLMTDGAEAATESMLDAILGVMRGAMLEGEDAVSAAQRIVRDAGRCAELEAQLQAAHAVLGTQANMRGLLVSHVPDSGPGYDEGGRYRLVLVSAEGGATKTNDVVDLVGGKISPFLDFGLLRDHLEKRLADFITPKAHQS